MALFLEHLLICIFVSSISGSAPSDLSLSEPPSIRFFAAAEIKLIQLETRRIYGTGELIGKNVNEIVNVISADTSIAEIVGNSSVFLENTDCPLENTTFSGTIKNDLLGNQCFNFSIIVHGAFIGRTSLLFYTNASETPITEMSYNVVVVRAYSLFAEIFTYSIIALLSLNTVGFGCSISLNEMWAILKRPIAPLIGIGCQFIINPLLAYSFGLLYGLRPAFALGLFALGCCPGGGGSNMWTYLLGGDLDLSILMTFCSTLVSFGTLPLWMYTLGSTLVPDSLELPFANIFYSLMALIVPCLIGILINKYAPKAAKRIRKLIKPTVITFLILVISMGVYNNIYMFTLMKDWRVLVSGFSAPYAAYFTSACVAAILRRPRKHILTISIETAIQNTGIAIVLILTTFPQPDADIAAVMPIAAVMFTPLPLACLLVIKTVRNKCFKSNEKEKEEQAAEGDTGSGEKAEINQAYGTPDNEAKSLASVV